MPKSVVGVQLTPHEISAVRLTRRWNRTTVEGVWRETRSLPSDNTVVGAVVLQIPPGEAVVAGLPADGAFHREFSLPFTDARKVAQAAPLEAEDSLPLPLEDLVCDVQVLAKGTGRSDVLVVAAPLDRVDQLLADFRSEGLDPTLLDVEALALATLCRRAIDRSEAALVLDLAPRLCQAVLVSQGIPQTFHAFSAPSDDPELLAELSSFLSGCERHRPDTVYLTGAGASEIDKTYWSRRLATPVELLPFGHLGVEASASDLLAWPAWAVPLGLALRGTEKTCASQINLLRGPYALASGSPPWQQTALAAAGYAVVLLSLWALTAWREAAELDTRRKTLERSIRATFQAALPGVKNIVSEVDQLRTQVAALEEQDRSLAGLSDPERAPLMLLRNLAAKIPRDAEVEVLDLSIDQEKVRLEGSTLSYRASERIKSEILSAAPKFATVSSEARDGAKPGEVVFTLSVNLGGKK